MIRSTILFNCTRKLKLVHINGNKELQAEVTIGSCNRIGQVDRWQMTGKWCVTLNDSRDMWITSIKMLVVLVVKLR